MARYIQLFVIFSLLVTAYCHPFRFGAGLAAKSHTEIGADVTAGVGGENSNGAYGKGRGFFDWFGSLGGGTYLGDVGIGGTVKSSVGAGVRGKTAGGLKVGENDNIEMQAGGDGFLQKDAHADVSGDVHIYNSKDIKELHDRNEVYANVGSKDEDDGYGDRKFGTTR